MKSNLVACLAVLAAFVCLAGICRADDIETITVNTSSLEGLVSSDGPFALAFSLTDGGVLDNNTVTLSDFSFAGGSASGTAITGPSDCSAYFFTCNETGLISNSDPADSTVVIDDSALYNGLVEGFTPGSTLSFTVDLTTNPDICAGCGDDTFVFQLLEQCSSVTDPCGNAPTTDALFSSFITVDLATDQVTAFDGTGDFSAVTATATPVVPEPSSLLLLGTGLAGLAFMRKRRRAYPRS